MSPSLVLEDLQGNVYTSNDNTTSFEAFVGTIFNLEVKGTPNAPFGLYMSLFTTPFPKDHTPPPLFLMPPLYPIIAGPDTILDSSGSYSFYALIPPDFTALGYDVYLYFQAFVQDPVYGFELTNGIEVVIVSSEYKADIAVGSGSGLKSVTLFGRVQDGNAGDNKVSGSDLLNGEDIVSDPGVAEGHVYAFQDDTTPQFGEIDPSTSIYLNGIFPLIPGDSRQDSRFGNYPQTGSSIDAFARTRICRSNENKYRQHLIVPKFDENGKKIRDLNIYHFRDKTTKEFGFFAVDVLNNDFYELTGSRVASNNPLLQVSPWDAYVAVSPDGDYMAAVVKDRIGDIQTQDDLYIIKLGKNDLWPSGTYQGLHARKVTLNESSNINFRTTRVFAESMTFAGDPDPHLLFFICNRCPKSPTDPVEPPLENPSVLWYTKASNPTGSGNYYKHSALPLVGGDQYEITFFGHPESYTNNNDKNLTELKLQRSDDNRTLCIRAAGRHVDKTDPKNWILGEWAFDILAITDIQVQDLGGISYNISNITKFPETKATQGFYIHPFGHGHIGIDRSNLSPGAGTFLAIVTETNNLENLYVVPTDGTKAGSLQPLTNEALFKTDFKSDRGVYDPLFLDDHNLLFYCGSKAVQSVQLYPPLTDLFIYKDLSGEFLNLTQTGKNPYPPYNTEPTPPFNYFGNVRPCGIFRSTDGRYVFFFRGKTGGGNLGSEYANLVGIDTLNNFTLFDCTGNEYSNGYINNLNTQYISITAVYWGPEQMNMIRVPTDTSEILYYTQQYAEPVTGNAQQVFMLNMDFPIASIPVTSFDPTTKGLIDNLVADQTATYIAFSRSDRLNFSNFEGAYEKVYVVDLTAGAYMRDLTQDPPYANHTAASIDGSFNFLPAHSGRVPGELIYGMGLGGSDAQANNPQKARIWLYPLQGVSNPAIKALSYPLTAEAFYLMFNSGIYEGP